jgi:hypothetical protein
MLVNCNDIGEKWLNCTRDKLRKVKMRVFIKCGLGSTILGRHD